MGAIGIIIKIGLVVAIFATTTLVGSTRRLGGFLTFVFSILLTPIGGFLLALISGPRKHQPKSRKNHG